MSNKFVKQEEEILEFWDKNKTFEKSVEKEAPNGDYVFYDGPPFATGTPHYGHIVASIMKDVVPRYWTMKGFRVERRWGWDCHGLPIENIVEKEIGSKAKKDIVEKIGVAKFNEMCRSKVLDYVEEWKKVMAKLGRWADMENSYKTMDLDFMESVWYVFKELYDKGLIYEGYRSMHICPRCETTLSQSEVSEGYKDIKDLSVIAKFELKYREGKTGRGVGALILNEKKEVLLVRRNENGRRVTWALPGGKVEDGESFCEALIREVKEELCVNVESMRAFSRQPDVVEGRLFEGMFFEVKIKGEPKIGVPDELDKLEWFSFDNLPDIDYPPSREAISIYKKIDSNNKVNEDITAPLPKVYILAWTTTPWTLLGNVALAINSNIKYEMIKVGDEYFLLAKDRLEDVLKDKEYKIITETGINGKDLVGLSYKPLFNYYSTNEHLENKENGWKIYGADFVNTEEGTGVVHIAPAFGEDDMKLGKKEKLPFIQHIGMDGVIKKEAVEFAGMSVKPLGDHTKTDVEIVKYLAHNNLLFAKEKYEHSYPHCWRCDTPLLNYATASWFVAITKIKEQMLENAKDINWSPSYIKEGSFGNWLEGARDWSISRQRFWASVIPIWKCEKCGEIKVIGSVKELEDLSGEKITDIHKHIVDEIKFKCEKCDGEMRRIPDVLDTWFDSGSMPYSQMHYPFENKEKFEKNFPAKFIAEGIDQTRCWFYYMHAIATGIKNTRAYDNVIVNGIVLAEDGKKMAKKLQNYPDPMEVLGKHGADALRFCLLTSPVMQAENLNFSESGVVEALRKNIMLIDNVLKFYEMFADEEAENSCCEKEKDVLQSENILDKWILAKLDQLATGITKYMDGYDLVRSSRLITEFIDDLSTWYLRRSRDRFKGDGCRDAINRVSTAGEARVSDKAVALQTTKFVLIELSKVMAPFMPFIAEDIWQKATGYNFENGERSVHLENWATSGRDAINRVSTMSDIQQTDQEGNDVLEDMLKTRKIVEIGMSLRAEVNMKVRQALSKIEIKGVELDSDYLELIKDELNVKEVVAVENIEGVEGVKIASEGDITIGLYTELTPELIQEGIAREIIRQINSIRKNKGLTIQDRVKIYYETESVSIREVLSKMDAQIRQGTLANEIILGGIEDGEEVKVNGEIVKLGVEKI